MIPIILLVLRLIAQLQMIWVDALAVVATVPDDVVRGRYLAVQDAKDEAVSGELMASKYPEIAKKLSDCFNEIFFQGTLTYVHPYELATGKRSILDVVNQ